MPGEYEFPKETGEQQLQRAADARRIRNERVLVIAALLIGPLWFWHDGWFEEGWDLLWLLPLLVVFATVWEGAFELAGAFISACLSPLTRRFRSRGYIQDDDEKAEPAPDYSMAEIVSPDSPDEGTR